MGFSRIRPDGDWTLNSTVEPEEFEALDDRYTAIDGATGGEHEPTVQIGIGGEGLGLAGENHEIRESAKLTNSGTIECADGSTIDVKEGALIIVRAGGELRLFGLNTGDAELKVQQYGTIVVAGSGPTAKGQITIGQYGTLRVLANGVLDVEDDGLATVKSGGKLAIADGGQIEVAGQVLLTADGDITVPSGGLILLASGSTLTAQGSVNLSSLNLVGSDVWPTLSTARDVSRAASRVTPLTFNNGASTVGPDDPDAWECKSDASASPAWRTRLATTSGKSSILEVVDLPIGSVITGATVQAKGVAALLASTLPTYQIVSWSSGEGGLVAHSSATADAGLAATFGSISAETAIGNTGTDEQRTVTAGRRYGILVTHPYDATGGGQAAWIYVATIEASAESIQV